MTPASHWTLIVLAAASNVVLNLSLRQMGRGVDTGGGAARLVFSILASPWTWLSCLAAAVLLTAFVAAIRLYSLSLTYTGVTVLAITILTAIGLATGEDPATPGRVGGLLLIFGGLALLARSA